MIPECVNSGGPASILELAERPTLEQPVRLSGGSLPALGIWQARLGEVLTVRDPEGAWYRARLAHWQDEVAELVPFEALTTNPESTLDIWVLQALPDRERFELVIEKLTEIGVTRIIPYHSTRSTRLEERDARQRKSHRWPVQVLRAARQCRRGQVPALYPVLEWDQALLIAARADLRLLLYEREDHWSFGELLAGGLPHQVSLMIGPEGGFTPDEVAAARDLGIVPAGLGPRLLRTETAAMLAAALTQFALGDLQ